MTLICATFDADLINISKLQAVKQSGPLFGLPCMFNMLNVPLHTIIVCTDVCTTVAPVAAVGDILILYHVNFK